MTDTDFDLLEEDQPRSAPEVAKRCLVLYAVVVAGHQEPRKELANWLRLENLWDAVSPREAMFLESEAPTRQQMINATWRAEALLPLLWALEKINSAALENTSCDLQLIVDALPSLFTSTSEFVSTATLRSEDDIAETRETIYQAHWTVRDAQINGRPVPNGYDAGTIQERHHALNWLIGYDNQDWDDITTDT